MDLESKVRGEWLLGIWSGALVTDGQPRRMSKFGKSCGAQREIS